MSRRTPSGGEGATAGETPPAEAAAGGEGEASGSARGASGRPPGLGAGQGAAAEDEQLQRQRLQHRMDEAKAKKASPSRSGEGLFEAIDCDRIEDVIYLLDEGADVNYIGMNGITPLDRAAICEREDVVALLLERGADANTVNVVGDSAMHYAAMYGRSGRSVDLLIAAGGDVDARNKVGETPLHWAAEENNEAAVRALLAAGARRDLKAWDGYNKNKMPIDVPTSPEIRDLLCS